MQGEILNKTDNIPALWSLDSRRPPALWACIDAQSCDFQTNSPWLWKRFSDSQLTLAVLFMSYLVNLTATPWLDTFNLPIFPKRKGNAYNSEQLVRGLRREEVIALEFRSWGYLMSETLIRMTAIFQDLYENFVNSPSWQMQFLCFPGNLLKLTDNLMPT